MFMQIVCKHFCDAYKMHKHSGFFFHPSPVLLLLQGIIWISSYSACVVCTKTNIHLSVGESGGYLPPLRWIIIVNYLYYYISCLVL